MADFVGATNFIDGRVLARDAEQGFHTVETELGTLKARSVDEVLPGDKVLLSVRPEDLELVEEQPANAANVWHSTVDQKVFLGEAMDFRIKVGQRVLLSRVHPSVRTPIGHGTWVRIDPAKIIAMRANGQHKAAA